MVRFERGRYLLFRLYRALEGNVVARNVSGLAGEEVPRDPPVGVRVVHYLHLVALHNV